MWSIMERHVTPAHRPWNVLLSVSMPNQFSPVSRTVAPVESTICEPRVLRYPVPVPPTAADAVPLRPTTATAPPAPSASAAATAISRESLVFMRRTLGWPAKTGQPSTLFIPAYGVAASNFAKRPAETFLRWLRLRVVVDAVDALDGQPALGDEQVEVQGGLHDRQHHVEAA